MKVKQSLLRYFSPNTPLPERLGYARGMGLEALSHEDRLTVFYILCRDPDANVTQAAKKSFMSFPVGELLYALHSVVDPLILKNIVSLHKNNDSVLIMAALNPGADEALLRALAETGPEELLSIICEDKELFEKHPGLVESIAKNPHALPEQIESLRAHISSPRDATKETAQNKPEEQRAPEDLIDEKAAVAETDENNMIKYISGLTVGKKIKLAISGNKAARELLSKESNKVVAISVLKNPRITEDEVMRLASSKSSSDDVLRFIGRNKEWTQNYNIRLNMLFNAKTPLAVSLKFVDHLNDKDLLKAARSRNIPSGVASAARRKLEAKKKH